ncbi:hypothetical protein MKX03_034751 [Papaver bracteatum]|nr:hypothetical protein MKX03_034751 [Papaver bracteatum]
MTKRHGRNNQKPEKKNRDLGGDVKVTEKSSPEDIAMEEKSLAMDIEEAEKSAEDIKKSLGQVLLSRDPNTSFSTIIKERFPCLGDCLDELNRGLTMVHLIAALPAVESKHIEVECIQSCRRLSHLWQAYISGTNSIREAQREKRGIYYQVEVKGHSIRYITPYPLQQVCTDHFKVVLIFLEFYEELLGSVLYTLYDSLPVRFPLDLNPDLEVLETDHPLSNYTAGKEWMLTVESDLRLAQLQHALTEFVSESANGTIGKDEADDETRDFKNLFRDLKFFLNQEVPKESLLFLISAFGGEVSWEGGPFTEADSKITHQICDRPTKRLGSRMCVQTRWIYVCVNLRRLLPVEPFLVGRVPPPASKKWET